MAKVLCPNCFQKDFFGGKCYKCDYELGERDKDALPAGHILAQHYYVGKILDRDDVTITYLVQDLRTETILEVKELYPTPWVTRGSDGHVHAGDEHKDAFELAKKTFKKEGEVLQGMDADNAFVAVKDIIARNDTIYLLQERTLGVTVSDKMQEEGKAFSPDRASKMIRQVARAVEDLHKSGTMFGNLAPDVMLVGDEDKITITELGITRSYVLKEINGGQPVLKEGFAPSEQHAGTEGLGAWTDVYALAASYYYILTGKRPLSALKRATGENLAVVSAVNPEVPGKTSEVISRAMAVLYWERTKAVATFLQELDKAEGITKTAPYVRVKLGDQMRQWKMIPDSDIRIGREDSDCEIGVPGDDISRLHCVVNYDSRKNEFTVTDHSANGTFTTRGLVGRGHSHTVAPGERLYLVSNRYEVFLEVK